MIEKALAAPLCDLIPFLSESQLAAFTAIVEGAGPSSSIGLSGSCLYSGMQTFTDIDLLCVCDADGPRGLEDLAIQMGFESQRTDFCGTSRLASYDVLGSWHQRDPSVHIEIMSKSTFRSLLVGRPFEVRRLKEGVSGLVAHRYVGSHCSCVLQRRNKDGVRYHYSVLPNVICKDEDQLFGPNFERALLAEFTSKSEAMELQDEAWDCLKGRFRSARVSACSLPFFAKDKFCRKFLRTLKKKMAIGSGHE